MTELSVNLSRRFPAEVVVQACIDSAVSLGWRAKPKEIYRQVLNIGRGPLDSPEYIFLYEGTEIRVGNLFPAFQVYNIFKGQDTNLIGIISGVPYYGFTSRFWIDRYIVELKSILARRDPENMDYKI